MTQPSGAVVAEAMIGPSSVPATGRKIDIGEIRVIFEGRQLVLLYSYSYCTSIPYRSEANHSQSQSPGAIANPRIALKSNSTVSSFSLYAQPLHRPLCYATLKTQAVLIQSPSTLGLRSQVTHRLAPNPPSGQILHRQTQLNQPFLHVWHQPTPRPFDCASLLAATAAVLQGIPSDKARDPLPYLNHTYMRLHKSRWDRLRSQTKPDFERRRSA